MAGDYIPHAYSKFNNWQKQLVKGLLTDPLTGDVTAFPPAPGADPANWEIWKIPQADMQKLVNGQATYQPYYDDWSDEDARNKTIVENHKREYGIYVKLIRKFVARWLRNNGKVKSGSKAGLGLTVPDTKRTSRAKIETRPLVKAEMKGGALLKLQFRVEGDSTRTSMHPDADVVELKYRIGGTEPASPAETNQTDTFSKARYHMQLDMADAGKFFYGFARWKNNTDNSKSGPWSLLIMIMIGN